MIVKVFESNSHGKIEFTRNELEKLLNEVYKKGYDCGVADTQRNSWTWTSPTLTSPTYRYDTAINSANTASISTATPHENIVNSEVNSTAMPKAATIQMKDVADSPINVNLARGIDEILNAIFNEGLGANVVKAEVDTPHSKLAKELKYL